MAAGLADIAEEEHSVTRNKQSGSQKGPRTNSLQKYRTWSPSAREEPNAARSPVAMGMVVATSLYCGVKAGIQVSH